MVVDMISTRALIVALIALTVVLIFTLGGVIWLLN